MTSKGGVEEHRESAASQRHLLSRDGPCLLAIGLAERVGAGTRSNGHTVCHAARDLAAFLQPVPNVGVGEFRCGRRRQLPRQRQGLRRRAAPQGRVLEIVQFLVTRWGAQPDPVTTQISFR